MSNGNTGSRYPILNHFNGEQIKESVDSFRKGEKGLFFFMKLAALILVAAGLWVYVLPPLFIMAGKALAVIGTLVLVGAFIIALPVIVKGLRRFTRFMHKSLIKHDPFGELYEQKDKLKANKTNFNLSQGKINNLREQMEVSASKSENDAADYQEKILQYNKKASKIKARMNAAIEKSGAAAKGEDEYINDNVELMKVVSQASRIGHMLEQAKDFVVKYGLRAATMKRLAQKLIMVGAALDIKILDFDATIEILEKDFEYAREAREATTVVKNSLEFEDGWEVKYALGVVTTTIAQDNAITSANFTDINALTANYDMDSDVLYDKLNILADNINTGNDIIPSANKFNAVDYKPTHEEKMTAGGGFGSDMF